jgi:hypothetical protein
MNQAMVTDMVPEAAKLSYASLKISYAQGLCSYKIYKRNNGKEGTHKNPVLTPQCVVVPLIMSGVQKLNMMATIFEKARDQAAVCARKRCCGISAA